MEEEWDEICRETKNERIVPAYHKTEVSGLQAFLREKFNLWAGNGNCVQEIWKSYKDIIFEGIERYVPQKIRTLNKEVKWVKVKVSITYNKRKFGLS